MHVKLARLTVETDAVVIEHPIREIGGLLSFEDGHAGPDGVDDPVRNVDGIAGFKVDLAQNFAERSVGDALQVFLA